MYVYIKMVKIWLKCPRKGCGYEWLYRGKKKAGIVACPICHTTLSIPRAAARYRKAKVERGRAKRERRNRG